MRDLVLAKRLKDEAIVFVTRDLEGNINHKIVEAGYALESVGSNDVEEFATLVKKYDPKMIVIDSYAIDIEYEKNLKELFPNTTLLVLDDNYKPHHCDILLNHNFYADVTKYDGLLPKNCTLWCGKKHTLLRDEFETAKNGKSIDFFHNHIVEAQTEGRICPRREGYERSLVKKRGKTKTILLSLGGSDPKNITLKLLKIVRKYKNIHTLTVTTSANKNLKKLDSFTRHKKNITLIINSNNMANLMKNSDFAIITPSVTVNEALFMGLPFLAIKTANNQNEAYRYLKNKGFRALGGYDKRVIERVMKGLDEA